MAVATLVAIATLVAVYTGAVTSEEQGGADRLRSVISLRFPGVEWVERRELSDWMAAGDDSMLVLLDARSEEEFRVSHLRAARRVDPAAEASSLAGLPRDARIVVYCSVGYRSAAVARRLTRAGYERVYNLEGGIFGWANEDRELHRGEEPASQVHPFDRTWGRLLDPRFHPKD